MSPGVCWGRGLGQARASRGPGRGWRTWWQSTEHAGGQLHVRKGSSPRPRSPGRELAWQILRPDHVGHQEDNGTNRAEGTGAGEEKAFSQTRMPVVIEGSQEETAFLKNKPKGPCWEPGKPGGNKEGQSDARQTRPVLPSPPLSPRPEEPEEPGGVRTEDRNTCNLSPAGCQGPVGWRQKTSSFESSLRL